MLERRERRALREHPAAEEMLHVGVGLALRPRFVDLQERRRVGRLLRRLLVASPRGDDERAETHGLIERRFHGRDPRRGLVEPLQHRDGNRQRRGGGRRGYGRLGGCGRFLLSLRCAQEHEKRDDREGRGSRHNPDFSARLWQENGNRRPYLARLTRAPRSLNPGHISICMVWISV